MTTIRNLMKPQLWKHCPGTENPADLPSRGITTMWLHGPALLQSKDSLIKDEDQDDTEGSVPDDCILEMKTKGHSHTLLTNKTNSFKSSRVSSVISPNNYSSIHRPLSVTALVKKFICCHGGRANTESVSKPLLTVDKIKQAHTLWMKDLQIELQKNNRFTYWKQQLGFYLDENGVWRCGGRLTNADIPTDNGTKFYWTRHITSLNSLSLTHITVCYITEWQIPFQSSRATYWLVRGRQYVHRLIHACVFCRKLEGRADQGKPPPSLPAF